MYSSCIHRRSIQHPFFVVKGHPFFRCSHLVVVITILSSLSENTLQYRNFTIMFGQPLVIGRGSNQ